MIDCRRCDCGCGAIRKMGCCIKEAEILAGKDAEIARLNAEVETWRAERTKLWQQIETAETQAKIEVLNKILGDVSEISERNPTRMKGGWYEGAIKTELKQLEQG